MYRGVVATKQATPQTGDETMNKPFEMKENDKNMKLVTTLMRSWCLFAKPVLLLTHFSNCMCVSSTGARPIR